MTLKPTAKAASHAILRYGMYVYIKQGGKVHSLQSLAMSILSWDRCQEREKTWGMLSLGYY